MEKVKAFFRNLPFRISFILYVIAALLLALFFSAITYNTAVSAILVPSVTDTSIEVSEAAMTALRAIEHWSLPVYITVCVSVAALLFYRVKMKKPLAVLEEASERISNSDLDFSILYQSKDEMGKLCASFELMRSALMENNRLMWRQVEQRKRLNAAFAHDLRTPLTVLHGQLEMAQQSENPPSEKTTAAMARQIERMERYVDSMSSLQKMEDVQPQYHSVVIADLVQSIQQMASVVCDSASKQVHFQNQTQSETVVLDESMVLQAVENMVSNAARYAKESVKISFMQQGDMLNIGVYDDGEGFSAEGINHAAEPFYTADPNRANHFGLGLYISELLCRHHGGGIEIKNDNGAAVTASFCIKSRE